VLLFKSRPLVRRTVIWAAQVCVFVAAGLAAFLLRFDLIIPPGARSHLIWGLGIWALVKSIVFSMCGLQRGWWRFVSVPDVVRLSVANIAGSVVSGIVIVAAVPAGFPRSIFALDLLVCFLASTGVRLASRMLIEIVRESKAGERRRVAIYGAGEAGILACREMKTNSRLGYRVCGFIDDDPAKHGIRIHGVPVLGTGSRLPEIAAGHEIQLVLIALPSATGAQTARILTHCGAAGVEVRTLPGITEALGRTSVSGAIREIEIEDVLGRIPINLESEIIRTKLEGQVVLVTGAGGSIGSELCRQLAGFHPALIVGYDISETALFFLGQEMRTRFTEAAFLEVIGSVQSETRLAETFQHYKPSVVFHAAAYKHVPMMEANIFEAVENNIFGTHLVGRAAAKAGTRTFVLISTDKAVKPTSIMGATKRVAEICTHSLDSDRMTAVSVRFGNVLGSSGSVIPIFKQQIAAGGPVTVTHPEMRRYFMTIPEAAQLVLQAATMGLGGEVFVLDMGEPVKILDLAKNLILLSGLRPDKDIPIKFVGIRPGEKLYEELDSLRDHTIPTRHERIRIYGTKTLPAEELSRRMIAMQRACAMRDGTGLLLALKELEPEYNPSTQLLRQTFSDQAEAGELKLAAAR
jgi:FlaA1/EpsC-like NDP-sugar epimerase